MIDRADSVLFDSATYRLLDTIPAWGYSLTTEVVLFITAYYVCETLRRSSGTARISRNIYLGASALLLLLSPVSVAFPIGGEPTMMGMTAQMSISGLLVLVIIITNITQIILGSHIAKTRSGRSAHFGLWLIVLPTLSNIGLVLFNLDLQSAPWLSYGIYLSAICQAALPFLLFSAFRGRTDGTPSRRWMLTGLIAGHIGMFSAIGINAATDPGSISTDEEYLEEETFAPDSLQDIAVPIEEFNVNSSDSAANISVEEDAEDIVWEDI